MSLAALQFDAESHTYTVGGKVLDSVTQILKPLSAAEYRGVSADVLDRAAQLGKAVHAVIELDNKRVLDVDALDPLLVPYYGHWRQFLAQSGFKPLLSEEKLHSLRYGYAGALDLFGTLNGEAALIDAKRTVKVPRLAGPQTAGYEILLRERRPDLIDAACSGPGNGRVHRYALHLTPDRWQLVPFKDPNDQRVFLSALTLHNWSKAA